jgi:peroxiredoxin
VARAKIGAVLQAGDAAPDFAIGGTTLHELLREREAVLFFFPKAFTPG